MDDQDLKFMCKLCKKKYPCGKSLGGHMRSHVNVIPTCSSSELDEQRGEVKKIASLKMQARFELGGNSGYGLRENPKKTWRATDSNLSVPQERVCKQCGKVFQSIKALCGHMACHSEKEKGGGLKDEHSWTSESKKVVVMDSNSDTEAEDLRNKSSVRPKRYKKIVHTCSFTLPNDVVVVNSGSEIFEQDQQEVAKCLMMLSRDSGNWNGVSSFMESSDNNSVVLETKSSSIDMKTPKMDGSNRDESPKTRKMEGIIVDAEVIESENSDSMYFLGENKAAESDVSVDGFHRNRGDKCFESKIRVETRRDGSSIAEKDHLKVMNRIKGYIKSRAGSKDYDYRDFGVASNSGKHDSRRKSKDSSYDPEYKTGSYKKIKLSFSDTKKKKKKYECLNCKKIFSSYQALGGHRPCHKRTLESRYETGENRPDVDTTYNNINGGNHREFLGSRKATAEGSPCYLGTKIKAKKAKGHECPFCHRVFKSGQALGGHKRSHFIDGAEENRHQRTQVIKAAIPGLLDLNVVPIESANDVQFMW